MPKVVHRDPGRRWERAKAFYGSVFGWQLQTMPMGEFGLHDLP